MTLLNTWITGEHGSHDDDRVCDDCASLHGRTWPAGVRSEAAPSRPEPPGHELHE